MVIMEKVLFNYYHFTYNEKRIVKKKNTIPKEKHEADVSYLT